jgi:glycosyltransferase involved in cell wall biosynthesis
MQNKKYIIKSLAPWMLDELIAFSQITSFEILFLRKQSDFFDEGLQQLIANGVIIHNRPKSLRKLCKKLSIAAQFVFINLKKFSFDYNGVIGFKSIVWFIRLDLSIFSPQSKIHAQFATQATIVSFLIKQYYNNDPEYSFTFHAYDIYFKNKWFKLLVVNCKNAFSISNYNIQYVKKNYVDSNKITLSRLGVFREPILYKLSNQSDSKIFTLGLISWFVEKKGITYLLQAFLELKKQGFSDIHLILAGDGPLKEEYLEFIKKNELSDSIKYIGKIKAGEKKSFFQSLDAFVLPSIALKNDQDGIPVVLMEAISYGLPIISTNVSGIPEICVNHYNGLLINEKDEKAIKESILVLSDTKLRERYALKSIEMSKLYDIEINSIKKIASLEW